MRNEIRCFLWKLIIFQCISTGLYSQNAQVSSLSETDSIKIYKLGNQAFALRKANPDSALLLANQALKLSQQFNHLRSQVSLLRIKGLVHHGLKQYDEALKYNNVALKLGRQIDYRVGTILNTIGNVYFFLEDDNNAIRNYEEALTYAREKKDTIGQIDALHNLGSVTTNSNKYEDAFNYYTESLALQRAKNFLKIELTTINHIAWLYLEKNELKQGIATFEEGIALAKARKNWKALATIYKYLGAGYQKKGFYDKSLAAYQLELNTREKLDDDIGLLNTKKKIALFSVAEGDLAEAMSYCEKGLSIAIENKDKIGEIEFLKYKGFILSFQNKCDTALTYFHQVLTKSERLKLIEWTAITLLGIGNCLEELNQLDSAAIYLHRAFPYAKNSNGASLQSKILTTLGKVHLKKSNYSLANQHLQKAIAFAKKGRLPKEESEATLLLYQLLSKQNQYQAALVQLERYQVLQGFLNDEERTKRVARLKADFDFEQEKQVLFQKNEQEKRVLDAQIRQQRIWILFTTFGLSFSLLLGYLIYRYQKLKRKNEIEKEKLKANLQEQERIKLEEMNAFKSKFFVNISHELRTPLSIIMGMNEKIKENPDEWSVVGTELIQKNANQLLSLTNQILEIQKLESQSVMLNYMQGDVVPFLKYLLSSFEALAENKQLKLIFETSPSTIIMDYDAEKLQWIVSNLLSNAIKFTPKNGKVGLSVYRVDEQLLLKVKDTGIGVLAEQKSKIFDRYFKIENEANPNGSGIGLALVKELVKLLNGEIQVESKIDIGSTFSVRLPITQNAALKEALSFQNDTSKVQDAVEQLHTYNTGEEKTSLPQLLIVEDNEDMVKFLKACLEGLYQLKIARNGQEGIEKAIETIPDIIISDVMMPIRNGYELCDSLKNDEHTSHIPIVLLTAKVDMESKLSGLAKGADAYLSKPFNEKELKLRLEKLLQLRKQLQQKYAQAPLSIDKQETKPSLEDLFLQKINVFVKDRMSQTDFDLGILCQHLHMSRSQVFRKIKALTGKSPTLYIRTIRLKAATELIQSTNLTMAEIAYQVGFSSTSYFSKTYSEEFKIRPSEVRK